MKKEMKDQIVSTKLGTIIIVIFTITAGMFVWQAEKDRQAAEQSPVLVNFKKPTMRQLPQINQGNDAQPNNQSDEKALNDSKITIKYTNKTYGFEFKYPQNLVIAQDSTDSRFGISDQPDGYWVYNITVTANTNNLSINQAFSRELARYEKTDKIITTSDITVGGKPAKKLSIQNPTDNGNVVVVIINGKNIITFYGSDSTTYLKSILEATLNSFKFIQ